MRKIGCAVFLAWVVIACSPPPEGTQYWQQVHREYESRDYIDTLNYLDDLLRSENTFNQRAAAMKITILGAMARAALDLEEACAKGIYRVAEWDSKPFKTCIEQFRFQARGRTLALIDTLNDFERVAATSDSVSLDFPLPEGASSPSSIVGRIRVGAMPTEKVFEPAVLRTTEHQIILQVRDFVGAEEVSETVELFASPPVTVSKGMFFVGVAKTLLASAAVFEKGRLDDSAKRSAVLKRARECLKSAGESGDAAAQSEAKALARKIGRTK
jgi:hypothetical protein